MYFLKFQDICTCMCQLATWHTGLRIPVVLLIRSKLAQFLESHVGPTQMGQGNVNGTVTYCLR